MVPEQRFVAIVDDDPSFVEMIQLALALEGHQSISCRCGPDAHVLVQQQQPDVVMLDLREQSLDAGWQVLEALRRDPATRAIPVIVSAGDAGLLREREQQLRAYGCAILLKPYALGALLAAIDRQVCSGRGGGAGA